MLAKLTSQNQITLPESALTSVDAAEYFEITVEDGRIILAPVALSQADAARQHIEQLGINEKDVEDAIAWARAGRS